MGFYKKYIVNGFFGWENFKWLIREIQATFSNKPSYFARKRIESFILFLNSIVILDAWTYKNINTISWEGIIAIFGAQMIYAGYQVQQIRKDILHINQKTNENTESV